MQNQENPLSCGLEVIWAKERELPNSTLKVISFIKMAPPSSYNTTVTLPTVLPLGNSTLSLHRGGPSMALSHHTANNPQGFHATPQFLQVNQQTSSGLLEPGWNLGLSGQCLQPLPLILMLPEPTGAQGHLLITMAMQLSRLSSSAVMSGGHRQSFLWRRWKRKAANNKRGFACVVY